MTANLIPLLKIEDVDGWPFSHSHTSYLVRTQQLGCVRIGRRVFLTREILDEFITRHIVQPKAASNDQAR